MTSREDFLATGKWDGILCKLLGLRPGKVLAFPAAG